MDGQTFHKFLRALRAPAIAVLVLLIPSSAYFLHVESQQESLKNRNFRVLATLSDQIQSKVNAYRTVIGHAAGEPDKDFRFGPFLQAQGLQCVTAKCEEEKAPGGGQCSLRVKRIDEDKPAIQFRYACPVGEARL